MSILKVCGISVVIFVFSLLAGCDEDASNDVLPLSVKASPGNRQITVSWSPPSDNGIAITGYTVLFMPSHTTACTTTGGVNDVSCTVPNLTNGTSYTFSVVANLANGNQSKQSNEASATPGGNDQTPNAVQGVAGDGKVLVSWSRPLVPTSNGSALYGYSVRTGTGASACPLQLDTFCIVTGLTNGKSYTFVTTATYRNNDSDTSFASSPVTPTAGFGYPAAPQSITATAGNSQAVVSWSTGQNTSGYPITKYIVAAVENPSVQCQSTASPCTVTGLINGQSYTFIVKAYNAWGAGQASSASAAVIPATLPGTPTNVTAAVGNGLASVTWYAPSNGGSAITQYTVKSSPGNFTCTGTQATCTVTGLTNGTAYTFTVTATNLIGTSPASTPSAAVTPTAIVTWTARTTGSTGSLFSIIWTGTQFVGVGYATIMTSPDGLTWTARTSGATTSLYGVAWGNNQFVVVGNSSNIFTSPDGINWTTQTISAATKGLQGVVWTGPSTGSGNGKFVVVGGGGLILTSPDGATWTKRSSDTTVNFYSVTWTGSKLLAPAASNSHETIFTSTDGVTWTSDTIQTTVHAIAWNGTLYLGAGNGLNYITSTNGVTWTNGPATGSSETINTVFWDGTRFLLAGEDGALMGSDGLTAGTPLQPAGTTTSWHWIAKSPTRTVVVGSSGNLLTSP